MPKLIDRSATIAAALRGLLSPRATARIGPQGRYDRLIDAVNRLPRPVLVYGAVALFLLALIRPDLFDRGMASLDRMPEELWWLIGAILAGHFGAREAHHLRARGTAAALPKTTAPGQEKAEPPSPG